MLSDAQRELLTARLRRGRTGIPGAIAPRPPGTTDLPLSSGQEQLWFLDRFAPGLATYNIPNALRLRGPLDAGALERALDGLVARHEALRTRLVSGADGRPRQIVDEPAGAGLTAVDLSAMDQAPRTAKLAEIAAAEAARPFGLAEGPLFRVRLVRLSDDEHVLITVVHHAVFDGWSIGVMLTELTHLYESELSGAPSRLAALPVQFADYALWERERLQAPPAKELLEYWRKRLDGYPTLQLPTDRPRPRLDGFQGAVEWLRMGTDVLAGLRELARAEGTTLFVTLMACLQTLLHRYTGQDDIVVGTLTAARGRPELAPLIGFLVNTLPIRTELTGDPTFRGLLGRVREATEGAYAHQDLPFAKLVEELKVPRDPSRAPVFQVAMTLAEAPGELTAGGLTVRLERLDLPAAKFDLSFVAEVRGDDLWVELSYSTALFDAATARRLLGNLRVLLTGVLEDPGRPLSRLPILTEAELHRELVEWNDTATDLPVMCVHERFERQVADTPDGVAAEMADESVSYAGLNADANRIARRLRGLGVERQTLVGVCMTPSPRRLAVLLGIMKAGAGYVPLDPALPAERLAYMIADTAMPVLVADDAGEPALPESGARTVRLDREWPEISALDPADPGFDVRTSDVAYVIYTSGSTGRPKGVVIEHRNAINFLTAMIEHHQVGPADRVLQFASLNFDASVIDMFTALLSGARTVLAAPETLHSPRRLARLMRDRAVTFAFLTPAVANLLAGEARGGAAQGERGGAGQGGHGGAGQGERGGAAQGERPGGAAQGGHGGAGQGERPGGAGQGERPGGAGQGERGGAAQGERPGGAGQGGHGGAGQGERPGGAGRGERGAGQGEIFPDLRVFLTGGEEMPAGMLGAWLRPGLRFGNEYGPTEVTVAAVSADLDGSVVPPPIGRPKPNCRAYVLDGNLNPVPVGVVGELHLGGVQVARGYLNAPELTARRFVDDPFGDGRLYRTGDLVRRLPDGNLVFVGRIDGQVKIRGLRVELGEIEAGLLAHPAVAQAVAVVATDRTGERQLAGYYRLDPDRAAATAAELRQHLTRRLPLYMVPGHLVAVDAFALNGSRKIDRSALPSIDEAVRTAGFEAPHTLIETVLADMYARLLGREQVGADDGFFELGGNSLQAIRLITQIAEELDPEPDVDVAAVFLAPSPRQLAVLLCDKHGLEDVDLSEEDGVLNPAAPLMTPSE
jgi:non-ribosomal peptide synthetase component F